MPSYVVLVNPINRSQMRRASLARNLVLEYHENPSAILVHD